MFCLQVLWAIFLSWFCLHFSFIFFVWLRFCGYSRHYFLKKKFTGKFIPIAFWITLNLTLDVSSVCSFFAFVFLSLSLSLFCT